MPLKQEVLQTIRELVPNRKVTLATGLAELSEEVEDGLEGLIEGVQEEWGIELPEESVLECENVGDLCDVVVEALAPLAQAEVGHAHRESPSP